MTKLNKRFLHNYKKYVFLDDIISEKGMFFVNPIDEITVYRQKDIKSAFEKIEKLKENYYLAGYIRYEFKDLLLGKEVKREKPFLWFGVFEKPINIDIVDDPNVFVPYIQINSQQNFNEYSSAIKEIKKQIELGNTYQVNYTFKNLLKAGCSIENLYLALRQKQKTHYASLIKNDFDTVLSFSPELFFEIEENKLKTKPMKGTIKKGLDEYQNLKNREFLANDEKNQAENVMIVDLLRNDMGKISKTSSVKVEKLFEIEEYETLFQMTSTITSKLKDHITFEEVIRALFPCGSITGAPKISTMDIIDKIEKNKRDIYCGAIGYISKDKTIMSVPIRILQKDGDDFAYHSGSGITYPSDEKQEFEECILKTKFLEYTQDFQLVETILFKDGKLIFEEEHFKRIKNSATFFGIKFNEKSFHVEAENDCIVRVLLDKKGFFSYEYLPLKEIKTNKVMVSKNRVDSKNVFLEHKTTCRPWYQNTMEQIENNEIYDEIFVNEKGEITEGARSNIFIKIGDKMYTPCSSCGILRGIYREKLLIENTVVQKVLTLDDLKGADEIYCANSVRGLIKVNLVSQCNLLSV